MRFNKRLLLAIFLGALFHTSIFFYLQQHEIHLTPMNRQGVVEWSLNEENNDIRIMEEIDRDEVMHAFFSPIAPEKDPLESLVSKPEAIDPPLQEAEELSFEEARDLEHAEVNKEVYTANLTDDLRLNLDDSNLNAYKESASGILSAKELIDHLELEGLAYGADNDNFIESEQANISEIPSPTANINQGLALSESTLWNQNKDANWEENLIASLETQSSNFTRFFRGNETQANSSTFQAKVEYIPRASHGDYLFRIALSPKNGKHFKRIKQNIFFLLDRSNSIGRNVYYETKDALSETLPLIHPEDHFTILIFDDEVSAYSQTPVIANEENIQKAQEFLRTARHGGLFAATDLYRSLDEIIPKKVSRHEANTAILLSDGDTFLSLSKQRKTIGEWTANNKGKVSLYSFAIGKKNNLPLLDAISSFNKGVLVHSPSIKTLPFVLKNFVQSIRYPLGKNFQVTSIPSEAYMQVQLYPKNERLPLFYENIPYTIYGKTSHLEDFSLFLQGKHYSSWLDIQVPISFTDATLADSSIEKQFAIQQSYDYYEEFLETGSMLPLIKARELLDPFEIETAFGNY